MTNLVTTETKVQLEKVFNDYVMSDIKVLKEETDNDAVKFVELIERWLPFRLEVSGGSVSSMGDVGCGSIDGFINELETYDDMGTDWNGAYRGDLRWESRELLFILLDESDIDKDIIILIKKIYNDRFFKDEEE